MDVRRNLSIARSSLEFFTLLFLTCPNHLYERSMQAVDAAFAVWSMQQIARYNLFFLLWSRVIRVLRSRTSIVWL
jgi:hypothetical protein